MKTRQNGLDLGRLVAMLFVVSLHTIGPLMLLDASKSADTTVMYFQIAVMVITKSLVNLFFLISGAFLMNSVSTANWKKMYEKTWKKLAIPTLVFMLIFLVTAPLFSLVNGMLTMERLPVAYLFQLGETVKGTSPSHLWYMAVLIGLYLLSPFFAKAKELLGESAFRKAAVILMLWGSVSAMSRSFTLTWDIGHVLGYAGVFLCGYGIFQRTKDTKSNGKALANFGVGLLICAFAAVLLVLVKPRFVSSAFAQALTTMESYSIFLQLGAVFFFRGFMMLDLKNDYGYLSSLTYWVYLAHPLLVTLGVHLLAEPRLRLFTNAQGLAACLVAIFYSLAVYVISLLLTHLWFRLRKKHSAKPVQS